MSHNQCVIGVKGVPSNWSAKLLYKTINKGGIKDKFQVLNFSKPKGATKVGFIRVNQDPMLAVHHFSRLKTTPKMHTFIMKSQSDKPKQGKGKWNAKKKPQKFGKTAATTPEWILQHTHQDLLEEIQRKFMALPDLSGKTNDKLLDEIAMTLFRRLKQIMETWNQPSADSFAISRFYRRKFPHTTDYELVMSTLHRIEDAAGTTRTEISESDLITNYNNKSPRGGSYEETKKIAIMVENRVIATMNRYTSRLLTEQSETDTPEEKARKRVWAELKKMEPTLSALVKLVISNNFPAPLDQDMNRTPVQMMRIYGEPELPNREVLNPLLDRYQPLYVGPSKILFNMLRFNVPLKKFPACMELDGKVIGMYKLIVRPSIGLDYKIKPMLLARILSAFKPTDKQTDQQTKPDSLLPQQSKDSPLLAAVMDYNDEDWGPYAGI